MVYFEIRSAIVSKFLKAGARAGGLFLTPFVIGCGSMRFADYHQIVPVSSEPRGAQILVNGEPAGKTPQFLSLRRGRATQIKLIFPDGEIREQKIEEKYRWSPSFYGNLFGLLVIYAPIGWGIDYLTGTAFEFRDLDVKLKEGSSLLKSDYQQGIWLVPPPRSDNEFLSEDVANLLDQRLRREFPRARIFSPEDQRISFFKAHWRYDNEPSDNEENDYLARVHATHIVRSRVETSRETVQIHWELEDAFTRQVLLERDFSLTSGEVTSFGHRSLVERLASRFNFVPDLVFFDIGPASTSVAIEDRAPVSSEDRGHPHFFGEALNYLGAVGITVANPANTRGGWKWDFSFVPSLQMIQRSEEFPDSPVLQGLLFDRFRVTMGYGPRLGVNSQYGYFYGMFVPMVGWTQLSISNGPSASRTDSVNLHLAFELGYSRFLSDRFYFRLFAKSVSENANLWRRAVDAALAQPINVHSVSYITGGFSLGYYFPEVRSWFRWRK